MLRCATCSVVPRRSTSTRLPTNKLSSLSPRSCETMIREFFGPVVAALDLLNAFREIVLAFVEPIGVGAFAGVLVARTVERDVARDRHPVADVGGEQVEPFGEAAVVEQLGFTGVERFDLALQQQLRELPLVDCGLRHADINSFQRV